MPQPILVQFKCEILKCWILELQSALFALVCHVNDFVFLMPACTLGEHRFTVTFVLTREVHVVKDLALLCEVP